MGLKMGLSIKQVGRMTLTLFNKLYDHYKNIFDFELMLNKAGTTYKEAHRQAQKSEEWF